MKVPITKKWFQSRAHLEEGQSIEAGALPPVAGPPREWRSAAFWHSDIEDIMDRIANEAMGYHPDSRAEFFRDVMAAIKDHLENDQSGGTP